MFLIPNISKIKGFEKYKIPRRYLNPRPMYSDAIKNVDQAMTK